MRTFGYAFLTFALLATAAQAAGVTTTTTTSGPPAGTPRTISTTGLTQYTVGGFTFSTNQTSGVVSFSTNNGTTTSTGTITIGN